MSIRRQNVFVFTPGRMVFGGEKFNFLYFLDDGKKLGWISIPGKGDASFLIMDQFSFPFFAFLPKKSFGDNCVLVSGKDEPKKGRLVSCS